MPELLRRIFSADGFMPHGHCYLWRPEVVWLHVVSDALITLSYLSIPFTLYYFARRRRDLPFRWMFMAFGFFIISCGLTHALEIWTLWEPLYWLSGIVKAIAAVASMTTAVLLVPVIPQALALPSPGALLAVNAELRRVEARFRAATEGMIDGFMVCEVVRDEAGVAADFRVTEANAAFIASLGTRRDAMVGSLLSEVYPKATFQLVFELCSRAAETKEAHSLETKLPPITEDIPLARMRWLSLDIVPLDDGVALTSRDITSRKRAEEFMLRNMSEGMSLVSAANDEIVFANPKMESLFGYAPGELEGAPAKAIAIASSSLRKLPRAYEGEEATKDGRRIQCRTTTDELEHPEYGRVWLVMKADVGERRAAEQVTARLASIVESTNDAIVSHSVNGLVETWNEGAERLYGYAARDVVGATVAGLVPVDLQDEERELLARVATGERVEALETVRIHRNGARLDVSLTASPIQTADGAIVGLSTIARDISRRKRDERTLQASLREKSLLLTEVQHRVKNNLQVVSSLLKLHGEQVKDPRAVAAFADSQTRVRSMGLLHELLLESKDLGAVAVASYAESLVSALGRSHGAGSVAFEVAASGLSLPMDEAAPLGMILHELVTNSLKHAFADRAGLPAVVRIGVRAVEQDIEVVVSDNGAGFPAGFDATATGSIGMHVVLALAEQLGGTIHFTSTSGGAESRLVFPRRSGGKRA